MKQMSFTNDGFLRQFQLALHCCGSGTAKGIPARQGLIYIKS